MYPLNLSGAQTQSAIQQRGPRSGMIARLWVLWSPLGIPQEIPAQPVGKLGSPKYQSTSNIESGNMGRSLLSCGEKWDLILQVVTSLVGTSYCRLDVAFGGTKSDHYNYWPGNFAACNPMSHSTWILRVLLFSQQNRLHFPQNESIALNAKFGFPEVSPTLYAAGTGFQCLHPNF